MVSQTLVAFKRWLVVARGSRLLHHRLKSTRKVALNHFKTQLEDHIEIVGGVGIGICVLQLIAIIVSFWVGKKMAEDNYFA